MGRLADMVQEDTRRVLDAVQSSGVMERGARMARRFIRSRTRRGIDRFGNEFAPYAPSTARQKGRFSPVSLRETGQMLGSLSIRTNDDVEFDPRLGPPGGGQLRNQSTGRLVSRDDIQFGAAVNLKGSRNRRIGRFHMEGTRHMPRRQWFGLTDNEEQQVVNELGTNTLDAIGREVPDDRRRRVQIRIF